MSCVPLVSIVTPSYNQGRFLRRTIQSILEQTYPHIEYLVIDGGSTDESVEILRSYGDRFFWTSEKDRGQAHAINKGFARAQGSILAYLNSDDVLLPDAVACVVDHFQSKPEWDLLYGEADNIDEQDCFLGRYPTEVFSLAVLLQECFICQPATFWRARLARQLGPFNESLHCCLDYEYWLRAARASARFGHVPKVLARSRLYPATKTMSLREKVYQETIQVQQEQVGFVELRPVRALWRHGCREQPRGWRRWLGLVPGCWPVAAVVHYSWLNRAKPWPWKLAAGLWRALRPFFQPGRGPAFPK